MGIELPGCRLSTDGKPTHRGIESSRLAQVNDGPPLKLPGWVSRPSELTPPLAIIQTLVRPPGPDIETLRNPANDVAYKMIGGAYGVLGAEVLGYYVPQSASQKRWGIYVREAGVAWLCRELGPHVKVTSVGGLPQRMARSITAHHNVHRVVEARFVTAHGEVAYLELLVNKSPRHSAIEEHLAELGFQLEATSGLDYQSRQQLVAPLHALMARAPEGKDPTDVADVALLVGRLNAEMSIGMTVADLDLTHSDLEMPCYLVLEPHLPQPLASAIRQALLG
jgi:hypothetical protein